jgi:hypothetical protein
MSADDIAGRLAEPFDPSEVRWKPAAVSGNRALAIAFVDARTVQQRLDDVLGIAGWTDAYKFLPDGSCVCKLTCLIGDRWVSKVDVGGPSEQEDEGDRRKAAISDALKRCAVKFGVGRFLYRLPRTWVSYNPQSRQLTPPELPAWALPWISPQQAEALAQLIGQAGVDVERFCKAYDISRPEHLPAAKFAEAQARLKAKLPAGNGSAAVKAAAGAARDTSVRLPPGGAAG